jgi:nicotinamide-nucleotide amidase
MHIEIVTIGNELLLGLTQDTNSSWLAQKLNGFGLQVSRITSVADSRKAILEILSETDARADIIIMTGGLGPTSDDITKPVLCEFFKTRLVFNNEIYEHIKSLLIGRNCEINEHNRKQAEVPESAAILHNDEGTAPGLWFEKGKKIFISLPGVPFEMKSLISNRVIPELRKRFAFPAVYYKTLVTQGSFEAQLAERLKDFEDELPGNISFAYIPSPGIIRLRLGTSGENPEVVKRNVEQQILRLQKIIPEYIVGYDNDTLQVIIGNMLNYRQQTLSVSESCTGGMISSLITSVPGSSAWFKGGLVAYSNEIKRDQLAVDKSVIDRYGAVSRNVVEDMAINTRLLFDTHYSVAVSGIAGPGGGSDEKPVGTTWIAVSSRNITRAEEFRFGDNRERNIIRASITGLNMLRKLIISQDSATDYL